MIDVRRVRSHNDTVEQDHRAIKRVVRPMLGCKSVEPARAPGRSLVTQCLRALLLGTAYNV